MEHGWSDDASRSDASGPSRPVGARFHTGRQAGPAPGRERAGSPFPVVVRGYERRRVDARLAELASELTTARAEAEDWRRRWCAAQQRSTELEAELREQRGGAPRREVGAAPIADKVLRLARMEAAQIRADAQREAEALLARARQQAS